MKVVVIGGIAAGLSAASQIRRLAPRSLVIVLEKSGDVSYAACGMPYNLFYPDTPVEKLYAMSLETIRKERGIDYRLNQEVTHIRPRRQEVAIRDHLNRRDYRESYDFLVYATGSRPNRVTLPGFDDGDVFYFRTLADTRQVKDFIRHRSPKRAVMIGSGYTNLEMSDVFYNMKIKPTLIDKADLILPMMTAESREKVLDKIAEKQIDFFVSTDVLEKSGPIVKTSAGDFQADLVIVAAGVHPNTELLAAAGGKLGVAGAVQVDRYLRTSIDTIFSGGDCAEQYVRQLRGNGYVPLGPAANKQGRLIGNNIVNQQAMKMFAGVDQTAVFKFFDLTVGTTGLHEKQVQELGKSYAKVSVDSPTRGEFPGGGVMRIVLMFEKVSGTLLGGEIVGQDVVAKRLDVLATAIYNQMTVFELAELDLSYCPPYAPVWDPILVAANQAIKQV